MGFEERLRETMRQSVSAVGRSEEAWRPIEARVRRRRARMRGTAMILAFAASASSLVALWVVFRPIDGLGRLSEAGSPGTSRAVRPGAHVISIAGEGGARALAFGAGSLWAAVADGSTGPELVRLDTDTGMVVATTPLDTVPGWKIGGGGLDIEEGAVWVVGSVRVDDHDLVIASRVDPATNQVADRFQVAEGVPADVAELGGSLWVLLRGDGEAVPEVLQLDPTTGRITARIEVPGAYGRRIVAAGGWVVALVATASGDGAIDGIDGSRLYRIDPRGGEVIGTFDPGSYAAVDAAAASVWLATGTSVLGFDPASGQILRSFAVPNTGDAVAWSPSGIWVLDPEGRLPALLDPSTGEVVRSQWPTPGFAPSAMAATPDGLWAVDHEGVLAHVELVP